MFPFAILDPSVSVKEFIKLCVIPFVKKLEIGEFRCKFASPLDDKLVSTTFCGGLNFILGMKERFFEKIVLIITFFLIVHRRPYGY